MVVAEKMNHCVQRLNLSPSLEVKDSRKMSFTSHLMFVSWIAISLHSLLLVADRSKHRVAVWSADHHQYLANFAARKYPLGIGVDLNGYVYVGCSGYQEAQLVRIYDPRKIDHFAANIG